MSKVDAQRAMREAKYARLRASGPTRREAAAAAGTGAAPAAPEAPEDTKAPARRTGRAVPAATEPEAVGTPGDAAVGLCGHKSMNGRTCTREAGHAEKNHRYG